MFLAIDQVGYVVAGQLEPVAVGDGVGGAGLHAVTAKDAAVVVNVINGGVPLAGADPLLGRVLPGNPSGGGPIGRQRPEPPRFSPCSRRPALPEPDRI